jgi:hypothetical protein
MTKDELIAIDRLWECVIILPSDYSDYGGEVIRWEDPEGDYPDCSCECKWFKPLYDEERQSWDTDWGVCSNPNSPRSGMLTWEHQHGFNCGYQYDHEVEV